MISVIIPTYNRAGILPRAVNSVLKQSYGNLELIIVDDASGDDTDNVVSCFNDKRIRYIRHEKNKGGSAARNTGITVSGGDFIGFLDDDDEWMPDKLEKQMAKFMIVKKEVGLIYCGTRILEGNRVLVTYYPVEKGDLRTRLLLGTTIGGTDPALVKKECFDEVGLFDENLKSCQDWDMWKRISEKYEFDFVPEILVNLHSHKHRISTDLASMIPGRTAMIRKHEEELRKYPDIYVVHLKRLGKLHALNGTWKESLSWFRKAVAVNRFELFNIFMWIVLEYPRVRFLSRLKNFKKYRIKQKIGLV